jgi:hypothetical protein
MWTMPTFSGGNSELTADQLNTVLEYIRKQGRIVPSPEVAVTQTPDGWMIRLNSPMGIWAMIGEQSGGRCAWTEMELTPDGSFMPHPSDKAGTPESGWAIEANGLACPSGVITWMEATGDPLGAAYVYAAPKLDYVPDNRTFWAKITGNKDGEYGYQELEFFEGGFFEKLGGRLIDAGEKSCAIEANGATSVPDDAVVLMYDFTSRVNPSDFPMDRVAFQYGSATARWAKLTSRNTNSVWKVDLGGPTGGSWKITITDAVEDKSWTGYVPFDATSEEVHNILVTVLGDPMLSKVADDSEADAAGGGPYLIEFFGRLGGGRDVTVEADAGETLQYSSDGSVTGTITAEKTTDDSGTTIDGKDDPYTDGSGAYGWVEIEFGKDLKPYIKFGGGQSDWPYNAAYEVGGETRVPADTIVRIYPGPTVTLAARDDGTGGTTDTRTLFRYGGAVGHWAMIGTAARWRVDLARPTAGMWVIHWDDGGKNNHYTPVNTSITLSATVTSGTWHLNWPQAVPTRQFVSGSWVTNNVVTVGPALALPTSPSQIVAAMEATYPILKGNIRATGDSLGTSTSVTTTNACGVSTTVVTWGKVVVELINDLAACCEVTNFTVTNMGGSDVKTGYGGRTLVPYNIPLISLGSWSAGSTAVVAHALPALPTSDWGVLACHPTGPPASLLYTPAANTEPFTIDAAGYDGKDDLPTVSIASFLKYGDDGTETETATISDAAPTPDYATTARIGRGLYHATLLTSDYGTGQLDPLLIDTRMVTVKAVEVNGRESVNVRTGVRLWTTGRFDLPPGGVDPVPERWAFQAPSGGFWASVATNLGGGDYTVTPWLTAYTRLRYVDVSEANGNALVPVGTRVWVEPSPADNKFTIRSTSRDRVAVVVYAGSQGVYPTEPTASGYVFVPGVSAANSQKCVVAAAPDCDHLTVGLAYAGRYDGEYSAIVGTIPKYKVESPIRRAGSGVIGAFENRDQILGGGSKIVRDGKVMWNTPPVSGTGGGDTLLPGATWGTTIVSPTEVFCGSTSVTGKKWGLRCTGPLADDSVVAPLILNGYSNNFLEAAGPSDTVWHVNDFSGNNNPLLAVAPALLLVWNNASGAHEYVELTQVCPDPTSTTFVHKAYFTVARAQRGTTALSFDVNDPIFPVSFPPSGSVFGPTNTRFWTNQAKLAVDGTAGGSDTVVIPGVIPSTDWTLAFGGGLQTAVSVGPDPGGRVYYGSFSVHSGADFQTLYVNNGLIINISTPFSGF